MPSRINSNILGPAKDGVGVSRVAGRPTYYVSRCSWPYPGVGSGPVVGPVSGPVLGPVSVLHGCGRLRRTFRIVHGEFGGPGQRLQVRQGVAGWCPGPLQIAAPVSAPNNVRAPFVRRSTTSTRSPRPPARAYVASSAGPRRTGGNRPPSERPGSLAPYRTNAEGERGQGEGILSVRDRRHRSEGRHRAAGCPHDAWQLRLVSGSASVLSLRG